MKKTYETVDGQVYGYAGIVVPLDSSTAIPADTHPRPSGDRWQDERVRERLVWAREVD